MRLIYITIVRLLYLILFAWFAFELSKGYLQLFGICVSNHPLYPITGSFRNPGPFGCMMSVGICLLTSYYIRIKTTSNQDVKSRLLCWIIGFIDVTAVVILPSIQSRSSILALFFSLILITIGTEQIKTKVQPLFKRYGILLLFGIIILGAGVYLLKKPSADGRMFIDKICINAIFENGWKGSGRHSFGEVYSSTQHDYFKKQINNNGTDDLDWTAIEEHDRLVSDCPDNAFNEYLFIGIEYGPFAMFMFIAIIVMAIVVSYRRGTIWCYGLTALAVFALFSYPLHVWQFQRLFPVLITASLLDGDKINKKSKKLELTILITALITVSFVTINRIPQIKKNRLANEMWKRTESLYRLKGYEYVVNECDTLLPYMKHDEGFLFAYGQSLNKLGYYIKSDSILQLGTKISSDPMFWNVMGNNSLAQGKYREAEERYKHAFYMVPNRLYPLYLLAKLYHTEGDTARFLKMAERVETFIPKVESVNTERLRSEIREIRDGYLPQIDQ